jgi:Electron transfer flavoprotein, alpha subunit
MAGVLVYSSKADLALELQTAAEVIAQGRNIKTLIINNSYDPADLAGKADAYICRQEDVCMSDAGAVASLVKAAIEKLACDIILLSSDRRGKELAGRLAQKMNAGCVTDVAALKLEGDKIIAARNALGGAVVAEQSIDSEVKVFAIAPKSYPVPEADQKDVGVKKIEIEAPDGAGRVSFIRSMPKTADSVDISAADILVVVGQGVEDQGQLAEIETIARAVKGEVACTKPVATDKKWYPEERIIGISGKTCKPQLALLLGISGQVQFWAGIRDAKIIAVVNIDENCGVMTMADYALVADVKRFVPDLLSQLA